MDEDVGSLKKIIIRHDNSGMGPAWLLDKVRIKKVKQSELIISFTLDTTCSISAGLG